MDVASGKEERPRHHADDFELPRAQRDGAAEDVRVAAERRLPERVAEDHDTVAALVGLFVPESAADQRLRAEHVEQIAGDRDRFDGLRLAGASQREIARAAAARRELLVRGDVDKRSVALAPVLPVRRGDDVLGPAPQRVGLVEAHQRVRIAKGQRAQQHRADEREHRGPGADADGERGDGRQRERPMLAERPDGVAHVLQRRLDAGDAAAVALLLLDLHRTSKAHKGGAARRFRRQAAALVLVREHLEVGLHFGVEVVVETGSGKVCTDLFEDDGEPGWHGRPPYPCETRRRRPMTPAIRSQLAACSASCFRPDRVMA